MKKAKYLVPTVVSFDEQGRLDRAGNEAVIEHLISGGVDGLLVMGSTGEFYSMTMDQKKELIDLAVWCVGHRVKLYFGTNCMRREDTIALSNYALEAGADGVMIIGPYYFALEDDALEAYYDDLCDNIHGTVFLYNYPERTGYDLKPEVALRLLRRHDNIKGFKDSHSQMGHTRQLLELTRAEYPEFEVYSGYDENLFHILLSGGDGCIGGLANLYPEVCSAFTAAINRQDIAACEKYQKIINCLMEFYTFGQPFMPLMKAAMRMRGVQVSEHCLSPLLLPTEEQKAKIMALMKKAEAMMREV